MTVALSRLQPGIRGSPGAKRRTRQRRLRVRPQRIVSGWRAVGPALCRTS